ncbi:MAG: FHA domain-containing protein [Pyrinomonadaceae bacterium]
MNQSLLALAFQESAPDDSSMWIILAVVLVFLIFVVVIVAVGLTIFFIMRKRSKALKATAQSDSSLSTGPSASAYAGMSQPETAQVAPEPEPPPPFVESPAPVYEDLPEVTALPEEFDPSRTMAISRDNTVAISYGSINFISGVLAGQQFDVEPEGSYIGRESTLSQIVVSDPRISKRHLWIGVRDGIVKIVDQGSRNGTFLNDPKSERITEAALSSGDTVIMGESDVARFEYQM